MDNGTPMRASERWRQSDEVGAGKWGMKGRAKPGKTEWGGQGQGIGESEKMQIFQDLSK